MVDKQFKFKVSMQTAGYCLYTTNPNISMSFSFIHNLYTVTVLLQLNICLSSQPQPFNLASKPWP